MFSSSRSPLRRAGPAPAIPRVRMLAVLSSADEAVLAALGDWRWEPAGMELVRETHPLNARILVSGWAARVRDLADGRRQIIGLVLPGDGVGVCRRPQPISQCPVVALTPIQTLEATPILRAIADPAAYPGLSIAVDLAAALDEVWLMEQIVRLGRLTAYERLAHLIMEIRFRLTTPETDADGRLPFPLTQEMLADVTGLSMVHVNRTLQQLRREKLIEVGQGRLRVLDSQALTSIADFREPKPNEWDFQL